MRHMDAEARSKRVLAIGILFAAVGIVSLGIALMQTEIPDGRERNASEIFNDEYTVEEKAEILAVLSASSTGADIPEEEKLRVLQSLRE